MNQRVCAVSFEIIHLSVGQALRIQSQPRIVRKEERSAVFHTKRQLDSEVGLAIIIVVGIEKSTNEVVSGPDIISRGFVYVRESEEIMVDSRNILINTLNNCSASEFKEWNTLKGKMRDALSDYIYQKTKRSPMILPIIMEV